MATQLLKKAVYLHWPMPARGDRAIGATQLEPAPVEMRLIPDDGSVELPPARRLLVLVPGPATPTALASRIWSLAAEAEMGVLFIGATGDGYDDYPMRRLLATLAAATRDRRLRVETRLVRGKNWLRAVCSLWQPGDLVICHSEQTVAAWGLKRRPLAPALMAALKSPVYVLTGFYPEPPTGPAVGGGRLRSLLPFLIIAGFFMLQALIEQSFTNWMYYPLMILSILVELGLLAVWH